MSSSYFSGDDYLVGIKNRKGAEGAGTHEHMAGLHQKREESDRISSEAGLHMAGFSRNDVCVERKVQFFHI